MAWQMDEIYRSSNGDTWQLLREAPSVRILVRHLANPSSGSRVTNLFVEQFLSLNGPGPEHKALRDLLRRIVGRS